MITLIVALVCIYRHIFSDWFISEDKAVLLGIAVILEFVIEFALLAVYKIWKVN